MLTEVERRRNTRVAVVCAIAFFGMVGAAFAAVPLYKAFCQATGFDGNPRRVSTAAGEVLGQTVTVRFDANVNGLPWTFTAEQASQQVRIGETKLAFFKVTNHAATPITARAVYNVTPETAGAYFNKLQCFCFSDQTIAAGATVEMPVLYFIDPGYAKDIDTKGEPQVTLSYTFFPSVKAAKSEAAKKG
ncbi:MAG: cytochrome c oxidase assembly protein [Caulobacterales bacterium]|nr:cytochrome c oxidase assembly protein [Caulobacterales bacterium]